MNEQDGDVIDTTCEQCGKGFNHNCTRALGRFDFCSIECENEFWFNHPPTERFVV